MVYVIVEHSLNRSGKAYFLDWIDEVRRLVQQFEGFQGISELLDTQNTSRTVLLLKFDVMEHLKIWSKSLEHDHALSLLEPMMIQKQKSQIFTNSFKH